MKPSARWGYIAFLAVVLAIVVALFPTKAGAGEPCKLVIPAEFTVVCRQTRAGQDIVLSCIDTKFRSFNLIRPRDQL